MFSALEHLPTITMYKGVMSRSGLNYEVKQKSLFFWFPTHINCPMTSSTGRLFDAVSALCGITLRASYDGQAATELEGAIDEETWRRAQELLAVNMTHDAGRKSPKLGQNIQARLIGYAVSLDKYVFHCGIFISCFHFGDTDVKSSLGKGIRK